MSNIWHDLPQPFFILAPMEAVTDVVFRHVVKQAGAPDVFFSEFTNATGWVHAGEKAIGGRLLKTEDEHPIVAQIWGGEPGDMEQLAVHCRELGYDAIDINMGCPAKSAVKSGGSALIRNPELASASIAAAKTAGLPVSVKTRLGYTYVDEWRDWLAHLLRQDIVNLTIHLRTKKEMSKVPAHFELIDEIVALRNKIAPHTLLAINGDIENREHGLKLIAEHPGVNGVMIGRGVFKNPFCFAKRRVGSKEYEVWENHANRVIVQDSVADDERDLFDKTPTPSLAPAGDTRLGENGAEQAAASGEMNSKMQLLQLLHFHLDLFDKYQGQLHRPFETLKRFFKIYIRDFEGASDLRAALMLTHSTREVRELLANHQNSITF